LRVLHLSTDDAANGAGRAAYRLHQGLLQAGVSSRMLVANKCTDDESVIRPALSRRIDYRLRRYSRRKLIAFDERRIARLRQSESEYFFTDRSEYVELCGSPIGNPCVLNLHSVIGFVDHPSFFAMLPPDKPVVWTLHDMNPFTGGCLLAWDCNKFTLECGACPVLGSKNAKDLASGIFHRKRAAYATLSRELVRIVAPSSWLAAEAKKSALFRHFDIATIPLGLDTELFKPRNKECARELFGIPSTYKIVMCFADRRYCKGIDLLIEALNKLDVRFPIGLISVGSGRLASTLRHRHFPLGYLKDERLLSFAYSAADVFVAPSRQESFGQVVFEAMACGTPVVGFDVGGIPDMVRPNVSGILAPPNDVSALRAGIETLLVNDEARLKMARECRRIAVEEYRLELQAKRYEAIYDDLLARAKHLPNVESGR
jgi:glycosyltransferase involved in cell wall biosynthesis